MYVCMYVCMYIVNEPCSLFYIRSPFKTRPLGGDVCCHSIKPVLRIISNVPLCQGWQASTRTSPNRVLIVLQIGQRRNDAVVPHSISDTNSSFDLPNASLVWQNWSYLWFDISVAAEDGAGQGVSYVGTGGWLGPQSWWRQPTAMHQQHLCIVTHNPVVDDVSSGIRYVHDLV